MRLTGYSDRFSARPGETLHFHVSATVPRYKAELVRVRHWDPNPGGPGLKEQRIAHPINRSYPGREQSVHPGSCVVVPSLPDLPTFTLGTWIWPTLPASGERQGIFSRGTGRGFALLIEADGCLALECRAGGGERRIWRSRVPLLHRRWYFVAVVCDRTTGRASPFCAPRDYSPHFESVTPENASVSLDRRPFEDTPLLMGTTGLRPGSARPSPRGAFNGKLADPAFLTGALDTGALHEWCEQGTPRGAIARWDLYREHGSTVAVDPAGGYHGEVVNRPTRLVTGPRYDGRCASPHEHPEQYNAIHLHDDDLGDCGWEVSFALEVPHGLPSGCYAVRLHAAGSEDRIPFFVRPAPGTKRTAIALLVPTLSYMAYANILAAPVGTYAALVRFPNKCPDPEITRYLARNRMGSLYDVHRDGSGRCMSSMHRPLYTMRPGAQEEWIDSPHQLPADLHLVDWLEEKGFAYEVLTDHDLHAEGVDALRPYVAVLSGTHAEYWTGPMLDALDAYQQGGGRFVYLSGNGLYWVTAISEDGVIAEVRRAHGTRAWSALPGESSISLSGEPGDMWRSRGRPPQRYVGVGFAAQGFDVGRPYRRSEASRDPRVAFIFEGVSDDVVGDLPALVCREGAASFEIDRVDYGLGTPAHALVLASASGFSDSYQAAVEDADAMAPCYGGSVDENVRADMVFYETPNHGAVFSAGAIGFCSTLSANGYDNNISKILENVVQSFLRPGPLPQ